MARQTLIIIILSLLTIGTMAQNSSPTRPLSTEERRVIIEKGTEIPFTGKYNKFDGKGTYSCRACGAPLYRSADKFDSRCGWPSFDDEIKGAVKRVADPDGRRTEIVCATCDGHLGHVFTGEEMTEKNTRHCVNSISIEFTPAEQLQLLDTAIFAGGCFWGVEHLMKKEAGVMSVESGYIGGVSVNPTYEDVCSGNSGHAEAVRITFNPKLVSYETLAKRFFEIHDPTQVGGQEPDKGDQYRSEIFYISPAQRTTAEKLITQLHAKGLKIATRLTPATQFYTGEDYHQNYYTRKGTQPYCHAYKKLF